MCAIPAHKKVIYSKNPILAKIQSAAANWEYVEFFDLIDQYEDTFSGEELGELYLARAQIKLFLTDDTMLDDLKMAKKLLPNGTGFTGISSAFAPDSASLFVVFKPEMGSLNSFKTVLPKSAPIFQKLCGGTTVDTAWAFESEILYLTGHIQKALEMAEPIYRRSTQNGGHYLAIISGFVLVRCYVAMGDTIKLGNVLNQLIRYSKILSRPRYRELYHYIMGWVNFTTGWMGETPRYHTTPDGVEVPVLDDRITQMNMGIADPGNIESALIAAAKRDSLECVSMKALYALLYEANVLFKLGHKSRAASLFCEAYTYTQKNRIIMPFVEYGKQILPLLQYALSHKGSAYLARRWSDKLNQMATQYEECLRIVRGDDSKGDVVNERLSPRELDILQKLVEEYTIAEVAEAMQMSFEEAKGEVRVLYRKMDVHNRSEAVAKAVGGHLLTKD